MIGCKEPPIVLRKFQLLKKFRWRRSRRPDNHIRIDNQATLENDRSRRHSRYALALDHLDSASLEFFRHKPACAVLEFGHDLAASGDQMQRVVSIRDRLQEFGNAECDFNAADPAADDHNSQRTAECHFGAMD